MSYAFHEREHPITVVLVQDHEQAKEETDYEPSVYVFRGHDLADAVLVDRVIELETYDVEEMTAEEQLAHAAERAALRDPARCTITIHHTWPMRRDWLREDPR